MDKSQYGLDPKPLGNHPKPPSPKGRTYGKREPKKLQVKKRVMGKWKTHPVDKMVKIANFIEASNPDLAAKIWMRILDSCELEEKAKKSFMPPSVGDESLAEREAAKALEEAEKDDEATPQSGSDGLERRETDLQAKTCPEKDLQGDPAEQGSDIRS